MIINTDLNSDQRPKHCFEPFAVILPENPETTAAIANDNTTAGPAMDLATTPANTYTPHPNVAPVPSAVKSKKVNTRFSFSLPVSSDSVFFLVNAHVNESV